MVGQTAHSTPSSSRASSADLDGEATLAADALSSASPAPYGAQPDSDASGSARFLRACDNCRRRKVKCDGVHPACGHCKRVETPCHYSLKPKSRRMWKCLEGTDDAPPGSTSFGAPSVPKARDDNTAKLLARMETMERLLMQRTGLSVPRGSGAGAVDGGVAGAAIAAPLQAAAGAQAGPAAAAASLRAGSLGHGDPAASGANGRRESNGVTHGHRVQSMPGPQPAALAPEVISDLVDTLFQGTIHAAEVPHEATFRKQFAAGTLPPLLLYSALASAARYSKNPAVCTDPPHNASAVYMNKAKQLVMDAIEEPSLGNAQGLLIMCLMHFALGNEVPSTFYRALALNMCIVLGYNRLDGVNSATSSTSSCMHEIVPSSTLAMDWVDRESARRLWWTIFSIENYSSVCMGLAPSIQAEHCDVRLPASTIEWKQGRSLTEDETGKPSKRPRIAENPLHQLPAYHSQLSLIFSKVAWLVTRTEGSVEDAVDQFANLNMVLQRWYEGLPKELRLSSVDTLLYGSHESSDYYQICVLHMRFYTAVIQLNHAIPEFTEDPLVIEPGQRKCVIAASRISDLLRSSYEIPVESRDMNWYMCVFRAAHIHIYRLLSRDTESIARAKQDLAIHRRHLREGGPLWRICLKLLSRLDDMEQMVMLLPAQIPMADLIKIKHLTRKGKSQLVNMQLDSLIKPALIHSEHANSEDLPLAARVDNSDARQQQQQLEQHAGLYYQPLDASSLGSMAGADDLLNKVGVSKHNSPLSMASRSSTTSQPPHSFTPAVSLHSGVDPSLAQMQHHALAGIAPGGVLPMGPAQHGTKGAMPLMPLTHLAAPMVQVPSDMQPINTNIVIDNNMAETLVHYFCSLANNNPPLQAAGQGPPAVGLSSPQMAVTGASTSATPQQQQQQALFGGPYDFGLPGLADNGNHSFV